MSKSTEKGTKKRGNRQNLIPWKKGQSGNPKGYKKGQRHYKTIYLEALRRIAEDTGYSAQEVEDAMTVKAIEKAIKGDFFFYKEVHDRIHGKAKDTMDIRSGGKTLAEVMLAAYKTAKDAQETAKPRRHRGKQ